MMDRVIKCEVTKKGKFLMEIMGFDEIFGKSIIKNVHLPKMCSLLQFVSLI